MSHRFVRMLASGVVIVGGMFFSTPTDAAAATTFACGQVYCQAGNDCPSEKELEDYCAFMDCPGLPGCAEDFGSCSGATVVCNANET